MHNKLYKCLHNACLFICTLGPKMARQTVWHDSGPLLRWHNQTGEMGRAVWSDAGPLLRQQNQTKRDSTGGLV